MPGRRLSAVNELSRRPIPNSDNWLGRERRALGVSGDRPDDVNGYRGRNILQRSINLCFLPPATVMDQSGPQKPGVANSPSRAPPPPKHLKSLKMF